MPRSSCTRLKPSALGVGPSQLFYRQLLLLVCVALAYALLGRLGLLLAIPPGYATALFPPAGLALACTLRWGPQVLPGVWLGSMLMNLSVMWPDGSWPNLGQAVLAGTLGVGAALQAVLGRTLLQEQHRTGDLFNDERGLLRFAVLGGALSTTVGASFGIGSLWLSGNIAANAVGFSWLTWWVGDSIGVLIVTPLTLLALSPAGSPGRLQLRAIALPITVTFILVTAVFVRVSAWENQKLQTAFYEQASRIVRNIQRAFLQHLDGLGQVARLYAASDDIDPNEFAVFTRELISRNEGSVSFGWVRNVSDGERERYEQAMRQILTPDFRIWRRDLSGNAMPAEPQPRYFPITYMEPAASYPLRGFDNGSEPLRRHLMEAALQQQLPLASPRLRLRQLERTTSAVLLAQPMMAGTGLATERDLIVAGVNIDSTVQHALRELPTDGLDVVISDLDADNERRLLYSSLPSPVRPKMLYQHESRWSFAGRHWQIEVLAPDQNLSFTRSWQAWLVLVGGMLFTGLTGAMLMLVHGRALRVQQLVTERTAELTRQQQTLQAISDSAADAILLLDETGAVHMANPAAERLLQMSAVLLRGKRLQQWLPDWQDAWLEPIDGNTVFRQETVLQSASGSLRNVELALSGLQRDGERRYCCLLHDLTERIAGERVKAEFVAMVSHELRTPLTSIRGALALLRHGDWQGDPEQRQRLLAMADDNSQRLLALVNDLLDFEKLEMGKLSISLEPTDLSAQLQHAIDEMTGFASSNQVRLLLDNNLPAGLTLPLAPPRFNQVMVNLLSNAVKFSPAGSAVTVRAYATSDRVHIAVSDEGIGIAPDKQQFIFQKFWQADASASRRHSGTGLGLAISKALVDLMHGQINFHSTAGRGTTFWLEFPLATPSATELS